MKECISTITEIITKTKTREKLVPKKQIRRIWEPITLAECIMQKEKHPKHFQLDMLPYYNYGNVSRNDLPGDEETNDKNKGRYKKNYDALRARTRFVREWKGMVE